MAAAEVDDVAKLRSQLARERSARKEAERELEFERARSATALQELSDQQEDAGTAGIAREDIFGRPSLTGARTLKRDYNNAVLDLAGISKENGFGAASLKASQNLLDDLALLGVGPIRGRYQSKRRDLARRIHTHPALLAQITEPRPGRPAALKLLFELTSHSHFEPTVRRVFERATERYDERKRNAGE